jgi:hypothetical protein
VRDANGQALAYVYSRPSETDAMQAKVLTEDPQGADPRGASSTGTAMSTSSPTRADALAQLRVQPGESGF